MAKELLYPQRYAFRTCRCTFGFDIIFRLYCSRKCAGLPERPHRVSRWPRRCRVCIDGTWQAKDVYFFPEEAERAARRLGGHWYLCETPDGCGAYHLSKNPEPYTPVASVTGKEN